MNNDSRIFSDETARALRSLLSGEASTRPFPSSISEKGEGGKFTPAGETLHHPGNTFICHIDPSCEFFAGLLAYQNDLKASRFADFYAFLEPSSFHMTIFCGVSGDPLGVDGWPEGYPRETDLEVFNRDFARRAAQLSCPDRFTVAAQGLQKLGTVDMEGAGPHDRAALRSARTALRALTGLHRDDFDRYRFHASLAYQHRWMTGADADAAIALANDLYQSHLADTGEIVLGPIEFCTFDTMQRFDRICIVGEGRG
ncbi:DUF1868 domain-containing protein [Rhodobacteraceae bacterium CCMM004]|nr:DUF1868 domain-containing protein [Rhodobacteraceae bacterium CCMM004]